MKMTGFRVQNFRSILDSGWVAIDDIAVIVGKNEAGKTSLLKALWKFNPFKPEPYNLDREWPRGRRKERSPDKEVVTVQFELTSEEQRKIHGIDESCSHVTGVEITKKYDGGSSYAFLPEVISSKAWVQKWFDAIGASASSSSLDFKSKLDQALKTSFDGVKNTEAGATDAGERLKKLKASLSAFATSEGENAEKDKEALVAAHSSVDKAVAALSGKAPVRAAIEEVSKRLPKFIYMDDHKAFTGSAHLDQVKQRKDREQLTEEDRTTILIMEMAGLDLDEEHTKGTAKDREQRILDMNDASQTLTNEISNRWRQKKYEVVFQADGHHIITFVKDTHAKALVPLEERSKGFQWFFSFDMTFMYETEGKFENAIILLDEPGLHLHAEAQRDLLERFKSYSEDNQLIYSTHLPFMIDSRRLDNIWVAEEKPEIGVQVHQNWGAADKDARFTLQAALGLSWSQSLFVGQYNLVVEGVTDFWFLTTMSSLLKDAGKPGLNDLLVITPAGGATKAAYVGTLLQGQRLNVAVLLDSDPEGQTAYKQLVHQWVLEEKHVLMLGSVVGKTGTCALEDLFSEDYYLSQVQESYRAELGGKTLKLLSENRSIVERVEASLQKVGIEHFNKGRVAKRIMSNLSTKGVADLTRETVENFEKAINALNEVVQTWLKDAKKDKFEMKESTSKTTPISGALT